MQATLQGFELHPADLQRLERGSMQNLIGCPGPGGAFEEDALPVNLYPHGSAATTYKL